MSLNDLANSSKSPLNLEEDNRKLLATISAAIIIEIPTTLLQRIAYKRNLMTSI